MANRLEKTIPITFLPGNPGTPAYAGEPARPAQTVTTQVQVCGGNAAYPPAPSASTPPGSIVRLPNGDLYWRPQSPTPGATAWRLRPGTAPSGSGFGGTTANCRTETRTTIIPGSPGYPPSPAIASSLGQFLEDLNPGWNSGGRSQASLDGPGRFIFRARANAGGMVVGFNHEDQNYGYQEIEHAWYFSGGAARMYENGTEVSSFGAYDGSEVFELRRSLDGTIEYVVDDVVEHTSGVVSTGPVFVDTSMYLGGDFIYDPEFLSYVDAQIEFEAMACFGGEGTTSAMGVVSFAPMEVEAYAFIVNEVEFEPMACFGGEGSGSSGIMSFEELEVEGDGYGFSLPVYSIAYPHFEPMQMVAQGHTAVGMHLSFEEMAALGSDNGDPDTVSPYGQGIMSFEPMYGGGSAYEGNNNASMIEYLFMLPQSTGLDNIFVVMNTSMTLASTLTVVLAITAELESSVTINDEISVAAMFQAIMNTLIEVGFAVPVYDQAAEVWVVNAETNGSTRYEDFDFNSYAKIGEQYYGLKADGLYLLEGGDDNGDPVRASISFGKRDFFTPKLKRLSNAYFGMSASGRMFVKVIAEGQSYVYATRSSSTDLQVQRADIGKGLRANYFELELYNEDGADFELSTVEFVAATVERRI